MWNNAQPEGHPTDEHELDLFHFGRRLAEQAVAPPAAGDPGPRWPRSPGLEASIGAGLRDTVEAHMTLCTPGWVGGLADHEWPACPVLAEFRRMVNRAREERTTDAATSA